MINLSGQRLEQYQNGRIIEIIPRQGYTVDTVQSFKGGKFGLVLPFEIDGETVTAELPNHQLLSYGVLTVRVTYRSEDGYYDSETQNFTVHRAVKPANYEFVENETLDLYDIGGGSGDSKLVVNFSYGENDEVLCDKTASEIKEAFDTGTEIVAKDAYFEMPLPLLRCFDNRGTITVIFGGWNATNSMFFLHINGSTITSETIGYTTS